MPLLTIEEVAEILKVTAKTVYKLISTGNLRAGKVGSQWRIKQSDLNTFLARE